MKPDLEKQLRESLQAVEPADGFAERVRHASSTNGGARERAVGVRWAPQALAASLLLAALGVYGWQHSASGRDSRRDSSCSRRCA